MKTIKNKFIHNFLSPDNAGLSLNQSLACDFQKQPNMVKL